jgi:broad specificity phosphatase PhoE
MSQAPSATTRPWVLLVRHGETTWSRNGQHTGRTDIPLTEAGRREAERLPAAIAGFDFALVLVSPLRRARETARIMGLGDARVCDDLAEWDYGDYEGRTTAEIRGERPRWSLWTDGCPGGEDAAAVGARADRVLLEVGAASGDVALVAHGHLLRVLTARWLRRPPGEGRLYRLDAAAVSHLGYEHEQRVIALWNSRAHLVET